MDKVDEEFIHHLARLMRAAGQVSTPIEDNSGAMDSYVMFVSHAENGRSYRLSIEKEEE